MMGTIAGTPDIASTDPRDELAQLHADNYAQLVRLASLLLGDVGRAEECAQEGFVRTFEAWERIRDPGRRLSYLRSAVLNSARNRRRGEARVLARTTSPRHGPDPVDSVVLSDRQRRLLREVGRLPTRQRECLLLRFYVDLAEAEIAQILGISAGSVKTHTHRGLRALETRVEDLR